MKDVIIEKEANNATHEAPTDIELLELEVGQAEVGQGTMAAFLAMRKRQRENVEKAGTNKNAPVTAETALPYYKDEEDHEAQVDVPKRFRGQTRMDKVYSRPFDKRVVVDMNNLFQLVSDDDKVVSELSNFLGTIAKRCLSLTYVSWRHVPVKLKDTMWNYVKQRYVIPEELRAWSMMTIQESWRGRKSRLKKAHYTRYENDEDRLENRSEDVPLETFKSLLEYWGDTTVQKKKMQEKMPDAGEPSDGLVFVKTHKRKEGRTYKADPSVINYRIEKIKKNLSTTGEGIDELITDGKAHGSPWLVGRAVNPSKISANAPKETYVHDLTSKICESLVEEVEAKVNRKLQSVVDAQINRKV